MADRAALTRGMDELKRDWIVFSVCTVILTPFALGLAGIVLLFSMSYAGMHMPIDIFGVAVSLEVFLGLAIVATAAGPTARTDGHGLTWCGAAALALALVVGLVHGVGLSGGALHATLGLGTILVLGLLGWAYAPKDEYYLGWLGGRMNDPFSLRDDVDRAHVGVGFALAIPRLIIASWSEVVGDAWLLKTLSFREQEAAASFIDALGRGEPPGPALGTLGPHASAHVLRALERMKLIRGRGQTLRLTEAGMRLATPGKPPAPTIEQRRPDIKVREKS